MYTCSVGMERRIFCRANEVEVIKQTLHECVRKRRAEAIARVDATACGLMQGCAWTWMGTCLLEGIKCYWLMLCCT